MFDRLRYHLPVFPLSPSHSLHSSFSNMIRDDDDSDGIKDDVMSDLGSNKLQGTTGTATSTSTNNSRADSSVTKRNAASTAVNVEDEHRETSKHFRSDQSQPLSTKSSTNEQNIIDSQTSIPGGTNSASMSGSGPSPLKVKTVQVPLHIFFESYKDDESVFQAIGKISDVSLDCLNVLASKGDENGLRNAVFNELLVNKSSNFLK